MKLNILFPCLLLGIALFLSTNLASAYSYDHRVELKTISGELFDGNLQLKVTLPLIGKAKVKKVEGKLTLDKPVAYEENSKQFKECSFIAESIEQGKLSEDKEAAYAKRTNTFAVSCSNDPNVVIYGNILANRLWKQYLSFDNIGLIFYVNKQEKGNELGEVLDFYEL